MTLNSSTVSNNTATGTGQGGGVWNSGVLRLTHATLAANSIAASLGGGVRTIGATNQLTIENSIVANNTAGSFGSNISGSGTIFMGINITSGDPLLAPLGDYGGPTQTMPPLPGSPAIDAAGPTSFLTDQRGLDRPSGPLPDIGAVEAFPFSTLSLDSTDGDSIPDLLEEGFFENTSVANDTSDFDGDGSSDAEEIANMTNPLDAEDFFRILSFTPAGTGPAGETLVDVTWKSFPGLSYTIQAKDDLDFETTPDELGTFPATDFTHTEQIEFDANLPWSFIRVGRE
jgi:hypothetical protein